MEGEKVVNFGEVAVRKSNSSVRLIVCVVGWYTLDTDGLTANVLVCTQYDTWSPPDDPGTPPDDPGTPPDDPGTYLGMTRYIPGSSSVIHRKT